MSEQGERATVPALERPARLRRSDPRLVRLVRLVALIAAMLLALRLVDWPRNRCGGPGRGSATSILSACFREYEDTGDVKTATAAAEQSLKFGRLTEARALAGALILTSAQPDAWRILGRIATATRDLQGAVIMLERSRRLHRLGHTPAGAALASQALIEALSRRDQFVEALRAAQDCIQDARTANDPRTEMYCHLSAEACLVKAGYFDLAQQELELAEPLSITKRDHAWWWYQRAKLAQEVDREPLRAAQYRQAIAIFERLLTPAWSAEVSELEISLELNLAYSLAEVGRTDDAELHLVNVELLDVDDDNATQCLAISARIAYRRGDLALAWSLNERAYAASDDNDERLEVAVLQARVALARADLAGAERWANRGILQVEEIRRAQSALELRPGVLSSRRAPYELLFTALARAGRIEDAVLAFDQWQGRTMLDALARRSGAPATLSEAAELTERRIAWLPAISRAPFARAPDREVLLETLRTIDLLALVVANGDVWCLTANQGKLHLDNLGPHAALRELLDRFEVAPTDRARASELGELVLRPETFRRTRAPLHVLLDGPVAALPVAALRHAGVPLIALRPVVRVSRLPDAACVVAAAPDHATVLVDAAGDLPDARRELGAVTALAVETRAAVGPEATSQALFAAAPHDVLQLSVHTDTGVGGGVLKLHDRDVSALEISSRRLGPRLVVLSTCGSASSNDAERSDSLATGFLAAGSPQVIATLRPVVDAGAREVVTRFYGAGGLADPVGVLAAVQLELSRTDNTDWPNFAVFGHDICSAAR